MKFTNKTSAGHLETVENTVKLALQSLSSDYPMLIIAKGVFLQKLLSALVPSKMLVKKAGELFRPHGG